MYEPKHRQEHTVKTTFRKACVRVAVLWSAAFLALMFLTFVKHPGPPVMVWVDPR